LLCRQLQQSDDQPRNNSSKGCCITHAWSLRRCHVSLLQRGGHRFQTTTIEIIKINDDDSISCWKANQNRLIPWRSLLASSSTDSLIVDEQSTTSIHHETGIQIHATISADSHRVHSIPDTTDASSKPDCCVKIRQLWLNYKVIRISGNVCTSNFVLECPRFPTNHKFEREASLLWVCSERQAGDDCRAVQLQE
jgi:hypothetical protein